MSYVDIFNTDPIQDLFSGIIPNSVMVADNESTIQGLSMKSGEILVGSGAGKIPNVATLQGTSKQINIDYLMDVGNRVLRFSLPQDLDIDSSPTFNKITADTVDTKSLIIDGSEIDFTKYVTTDTKQTITGEKSFYERIRTMALEPITTKQHDLGTADRRYRHLYLGHASGTVDLGIDSKGSATLKLVSIGSIEQKITFGEVDDKYNWKFSSRDFYEGRDFYFYRGPYLTDSDPELIYRISGAGTNPGQFVFTKTDDSIDLKTGAVRVLGGMSVAKSMNIGNNINAGSVSATDISATSSINAESVSAESVSATSITATSSITTDVLTASTLNISDGITIPGLNPNTVVGTDLEGNLQSLTTASNNGVVATVSDGTLTIDTPQDLRTTAEPTFNAMTITTITSPGLTDPINLMKPLYVHGAIRPHPDSANNRRSLGTLAGRWANLRMGFDGSVCDIECLNLGGIRGNISAVSNQQTRFTYGPIWRFNCLEDSNGHDLMFNSIEGITDVNVVTVKGIGPNRRQILFNHTLDSIGKSDGSVVFKGGIGIEKALHAGSVNATSSLVVAGTAVTPTNYVTLSGNQTVTGTKTFSSTIIPSSTAVNLGSAANRFGHVHAMGMTIDGFGLQPANYVLTHSNQTIGGQKTFTDRIVGTSDIMIGGVSHGILRLSSYGGGDARVEGGYVTDAEYFLRFYCRGELVAEMNHGYEGSGRTREFHLYGGLYFRNGGNTRMSYYGATTLNTSFVAEGTAAISVNPAVTIRCVRVGHTVTLDVAPSQTNFLVTNGNPVLITQAQIHGDYRPSSTKQGSCVVNNNNNRFVTALVSVNSLGIIKIEPWPMGYFVGSLGSSNNLYSFSISYNLN